EMRVIMKKYTFEDILLNQINIPLSLIKNYKNIGLNENELAMILQVYRFMHEGNNFPTPSEMAQYLTLIEEKCADILKNLMQKNIIIISEENNEYNKISESYSLNLSWEKLYNKINNKQKNDLELDESGSIFILFKQAIGRPLSPFEIKTITVGLDEDLIQPSLI